MRSDKDLEKLLAKRQRELAYRNQPTTEWTGSDRNTNEAWGCVACIAAGIGTIVLIYQIGKALLQ